MNKIKSLLIKTFSIAFAVCAAFAIATMPNAVTVSAADEASFKVNGTSIYAYDVEGESKVGLRFEAQFNNAWLSANPAEKYTFGMIIAPTANFEAAEAVGAEKPWSDENTPTLNMKAVDGVNFIRIQNKVVSQGETFYAGVLFDDDSLTGIIEDINTEKGTVVDDDGFAIQLTNLKENIFKQGYSAVAYVTIGGQTQYLARYDTSMRETAAKTYAAGVAENNEGYKKLALPYLGVTESDVKYESAYVIKEVRELVVDSVENFEIKEEDIIVSDGKLLKLGKDYSLENGVVTFVAEKSTRDQEQIYIFRDGDINIVDVLYANKELSSASEVFDFFMNKDNFTYSEANKAHYNSNVAVLANDIDMSEEVLYNYTPVYFSGLFDGRGHVLSNVTLEVVDDANTKNSTYGLFGVITNYGVIKNVAFNNIKSIDHQANGAVIGYSFAGLIENVYLSYSVDNQSKSGMFVLAESGTMRNMVIMDNYYDPTYDPDTYIQENTSSWGVSPIVRAISDKSATFENVQVISRRPINFNSTGADKLDVVYTPSTDGVTPATVSSWGARTAYGENETKLFVEFDYFYRSTTDVDAPGLGLDRETATVQDTVGCGKTILVNGLRRYDDMEAFIADEANAENRAKLIATGFWKEVDGDVVWAKNDMITPKISIEYLEEVDYDASTGILYTTAFNGQTIEKITLNGAALTAEENGGLVVDGDGKIVGVRAKVNASDENLGIAYRDNKDGTSNVINYNNKLIVYAGNKIVYIKNVKYYTQLIFDTTDLREALGYNVDYKVATYTADTATDREAALNGKGYFVATTKDGSNYYEGVYNSGVYKMMANLDMEKAGIGYTDNDLASGSKIGGFVGYFDGNGYTIANFKPEAQGLFGRVGTYVAGNVVAGTNVTAGNRYVNCKPVIKNLALTEVITTYYDAPNFHATPILANLLGTNTYAASPHTTTVENIYVTVSTTDSTAPGSLVVHLGGHTKMNNVYIENQNEFNMVEVDGKFYRMTDEPSRPTVENGTKVWNVMKNWKESREGVLFGWAYSALHGTPGNDYIATGTLDNTTNTYVVSTMPINFSSKSSMFVYAYHASYTGIKFSAENGIEFNNDSIYKLGQINKDKTSVYVAVAYAANEEVGNILIPYGFKQSAIDDVKYILSPVTEDPLTTGLGLTSIGSYGGSAFMCNKCGEIAFSVTGRTVGGNGACLLGCGGKYVNTENYKVKNSANASGTGPLASPCVYEFTVHAAADMGEYYAHDNGAFKLKGVYKYSDVDAMKNAVNDYSSFTGEKGNGLWEVVETKDGEDNVIARELKWVGRVA